MKKSLLVLLVTFISFGLFGCENEEEQEIVHDIPDEVFINLNELEYSEYVNLSNPVVTITIKGMGDIVLQLFPDIAPNTVNNFIHYIQDEYYTDNEFHRVISGFMIQGGKLENPSCSIEGEMTNNGFDNDLEHHRGVLSMARIGGDYDSQNSQFFIVQQKARSLDGEYATFGGVITGFNIIDYIANLATDGNDDPLVRVVIESITVDLKGKTYSAPICFDN